MAMRLIAGLLGVVIFVTAIGGCAMGNEGTVHYNRTTTTGQELIDLKKAKDQGAMTEQEYEEVKKDLMKCGIIKLECSSAKKCKNQR